MSTKLRCVIGAALAVVFIDLMVIGVKIFDGNYNIAAEGVVGLVGFAVVGVCGFIGLYRELKKRKQSKKG
ncbi:MAG: hypothetical protein NC299_03240 [Lachnospiraceae bacterium]|nr:hypothetical protein [Ruminococcus sp.]MCM1274363.1 hypothetical protein [Lachnospiraceae bacterium]